MRDLDALLAPEGRRLLDALRECAGEDDLKIITRFRATHEAELVRAALSLTKLRARARAKFSRADEMFFTAPGLEQASTEAMASHTAARFAPYARIADLCSGIGGDLIALAARSEVASVDIDPVHLRMGALNAAVYGVADNVRPVQADVRDVLLDSYDAAFIDPARRSRDTRFRGGESEPPLDWCFGVAARGLPLGVKAAPGIDTAVVPAGWELEFVSEGRELKAAVLWSPPLASARRRATIVPGGATLTESPAAAVHLEIRAPGDYLLDPDPAVTRAGLVEELGASIEASGGDSLWKIDERVAFLSCDRPVATPFGRTLVVEESLPWSLARLKDALRARDVGVVDIRKRGSAVDVDEIQRRLRLTGSRRATVVLTRVADRPWAMVCTDPDLT